MKNLEVNLTKKKNMNIMSQLQKSENGFLLFNGIFDKYNLSQYYLGINIELYLSKLFVKNLKNSNFITFAKGAILLTFLLTTINCSATDKVLKLNEDILELNRNQGGVVSSYAPILKKISNSVVTIYSTKTIKMNRSRYHKDPLFEKFFGGEIPQRQFKDIRKQARGVGSGVIITEDGYILTNNHVVQDADKVKVSIANDKTKYEAKIIGLDPKSDLALIKIDAVDLNVAIVADSDKVLIGDIVFAIGNPFGIGKTVTQGIISAKGRNIGLVDYEDFLQTDAAINPGNSGGALIDAKGRLIGINTAILSRSGGNQGIGLAIPINNAKKIAKKLLASGKILRGFLGVAIQNIDEDLKSIMNLPTNKGVLVNNVQENSAAEVAGIKNGDVIVKVNSLEIKDVAHIRFVISEINPNTETDITIIRDGEELVLTAKLKTMDDPNVTNLKNDNLENSLLKGIHFFNIPKELRARLKLDKKTKGVIVKRVDNDSVAYIAGIKIGDIIVEINKTQIENLKDLNKIISKLKNNNLLLRLIRNGYARYMVLKNNKKGD